VTYCFVGQHICEEKILNAVSIDKDVDGFHPLNIGRLAMQGREPLFVPCTPKGCIELLIRSGIDMMGKRAVVIARSNIVGAPAAMLLQVSSFCECNLSLFYHNSNCFLLQKEMCFV